jgi:hypothetical protein
VRSGIEVGVFTQQVAVLVLDLVGLLVVARVSLDWEVNGVSVHLMEVSEFVHVHFGVVKRLD